MFICEIHIMHIIQSCNLGADNINLPLLRLQNVVCLERQRTSLSFRISNNCLCFGYVPSAPKKHQHCITTKHKTIGKYRHVKWIRAKKKKGNIGTCMQSLSCGLMLHKSGLVFVLPQGAFATTRTTVESWTSLRTAATLRKVSTGWVTTSSIKSF
jgi:hypothetical protein